MYRCLYYLKFVNFTHTVWQVTKEKLTSTTPLDNVTVYFPDTVSILNSTEEYHTTRVLQWPESGLGNTVITENINCGRIAHNQITDNGIIIMPRLLQENMTARNICLSSEKFRAIFAAILSLNEFAILCIEIPTVQKIETSIDFWWYMRFPQT